MTTGRDLQTASNDGDESVMTAGAAFKFEFDPMERAMNGDFLSEVMDEIGTQTLARFGLNIFDKNSYEAYAASVVGANAAARIYEQRKDTPEKFAAFFRKKFARYQADKAALGAAFTPQPEFERLFADFERDPAGFGRRFERYYAANRGAFASKSPLRDLYDRYSGKSLTTHGHYFETLGAAAQNVRLAHDKIPAKEYTTDILADIWQVQSGKIRSGKTYDFIMQNYAEEVRGLDFGSGDLARLIAASASPGGLKNHSESDTVRLAGSRVVFRSQYKVDKNTNNLLQERYLQNDAIEVPADDYAQHMANLERKIATTSGRERELARGVLARLRAREIWREQLGDVRGEAFGLQRAAAAQHVVQTGASDAIVVVLSTLANGAIFELRDALSGGALSGAGAGGAGGAEMGAMARVRRLIDKVVEAAKRAFARGAGFGAVEVAVGVAGQIFGSFFGALKGLWSRFRTALKSFFNALCDFVRGKKTFREVAHMLLKGLFSGVIAVGVVGLEAQLGAALAGVLGPLAGVVAGVISIVVGALAVVAMSRSVDAVLDALFGAFARLEVARKRASEIEALIAAQLPTLVARREELARIIERTHHERMRTLDASFADYERAAARGEIGVEFLDEVCALWGGRIETRTMGDLQRKLQANTGLLKW